MKAIIEEGDAEIAAKMQDLALAEGALPRHLHTAMFTQSTDSRMLTVRYQRDVTVSVCLSVCHIAIINTHMHGRYIPLLG